MLFTEGPITGPLIRFAMPMLAASFLQSMYGAVDLMVVGRFAGTADVSAVSTGSQVMMTVTSIFMGLAMGMTILLGQKIGEGNAKEGGRIIGAGIALFAVIGVTASVLLGISAPSLASLMNAPAESFTRAAQYIRICGIGSLAIIAYNTLGAVFRGIGDSRTPVRYLVVSCIINMVMDLALVAGFGMGVLGAALATALAQGISAVLCIRYVVRNVPELRFPWHRMGINRTLAGKTLSYGIFTALQQCSQPIGNIIIQGSVNTLGVATAAAFSAVRKIEDIGLLPGRSISVAMTAFLAQNEGAGDHSRSDEGYRKGMLLEIMAGVCVCAIVLLLRAPLMSLFSTDGAIVAAGIQYFDIIGFFYWLPSLTNGLQGGYRGFGAMRASLLGSLTQISVRVAVTLLTVNTMGITGVGLACVCGWSAMLIWGLPWLYWYRRKVRKKK
jgi:putative MATE family efflux protein